ncbi:uncharacterized protein [Salminus brasiliensis]|uniref:uncharacterized protein n=1 Tax=Salminus brasiliensis TaxID=930266 RepID=UPI003B8395C9
MDRQNERNHKEVFFPGQHLKFHELRERIRNVYLNRYQHIPRSPDPVEFHVSNLRHDTCYSSFQAIMRDGGFKKPGPEVTSAKSLVWWSLAVSEDDIAEAECRFLQYFKMIEDCKPFLRKFTSSPAFRKSSRMGNFRFTFSLRGLLANYKAQFCMGQEPQIRIYETVVYKQEVMYSIVVHGPAAQNDFGKYPLLQDSRANAVCLFQGENILWRPEGMSKTHAFRLVMGEEVLARRVLRRKRQFYAWDHVAVAFHVPQGKTFKFDHGTLRSHLSLCQGAELNLSNEEFIQCDFEALLTQ